MYVTYQDLIQIGILVFALANLIYQINKGKKKQPPLPSIVTACLCISIQVFCFHILSQNFHTILALAY